MKGYTLGIDIGTTAVKAVLISGDGELIAQANAAHDLISLYPGWAEERADIWWDNVCIALRSILCAHRDKLPFIRAVGVSGMVPAIVLLDAEGNVLRNTIQQNDARATEELERVKLNTDAKELFERTGTYANLQHVTPRLMWVMAHERDVWENTCTVMGSYDYILYKLTGARRVELNWAAESGLFDIRKKLWIYDYCDRFNIPRALLPEVAEPGIIAGYTRGVEGETLLPDGIPVIGGSADHVASTLSAGITEPGELLIKFGGGGDVLYCADDIIPCEELFFDYHIVPGKYLVNGCMASSGSLVKWYVNGILGETRPDALAELDRRASLVPAGSDGLIILPYFLGEKTPIFDPEARGVMLGLTLSHTPEHIFRAILEAVVYGFRHHVDVLAAHGMRSTRVKATNGGSKSRFWCQIAADVLGCDITSYPTHPGSALGVAYLAAMSAGLYTDWRDVSRFLEKGVTYTPNPDNRAVYDKAYAVYRRAYEDLRGCFSDIAQIRS